MKNINKRGFTLLELMIVLVMVAILAAVTVPQLVQVSNRNKLGEVTNMFQEIVAEARSLAIKSRQAVVVEVRNNQVWVNLLQGTDCGGNVRTQCFTAVDALGTNVLNLDTAEFQNAGIDMCNLRIATIDNSGACVVSSDLSTSGVGLCYNGSGQLWIRSGADANTVCTGSTTSDPAAVWQKACVPWMGANATVSTTQATWFSGADVRFNRFTAGSGSCPVGSITPTGAEGITRRVLVPAGGHPLVKMAEVDI